MQRCTFKVLFAAVIGLSATLFTQAAQAEIFFGPNFHYREEKVETGGSTAKLNVTVIDARLGYVLPAGLYVGGLYNTETTKSGSFEEKGSHYGPSVGYVTKNFNVIASYYMGGERSYTGGVKRIEVSGPQVDLGYMFDLGSGTLLGPQLSWRSIEYAKVKANGLEAADKYKLTEIRPMIALAFMF